MVYEKCLKEMISPKILALVVALVPALFATAGTIQGTVVFEGNAPKMPIIEMDVDPICASKHSEPVRAEVLVLGEGQTMANVIVQITGGRPAGDDAPPTEPVVVTQEGCRYSPHVFVVRLGQALKVLNPDGTLHNIHGLAKVNPEFNRSMIKSMKELTLNFEKVEPGFALRCQVHPWMTAYCAVLDHSYFRVTATDGAYSFKGLPPGEYTIEAWHERLGTQSGKVSIGAEGETAVLDFEFSRARR